MIPAYTESIDGWAAALLIAAAWIAAGIAYINNRRD